MPEHVAHETLPSQAVRALRSASYAAIAVSCAPSVAATHLVPAPMLADPRLVEAKPVEVLDHREVAMQGEGRVDAGLVFGARAVSDQRR